jgi:hypothetical protein
MLTKKGPSKRPSIFTNHSSDISQKIAVLKLKVISRWRVRIFKKARETKDGQYIPPLLFMTKFSEVVSNILFR